MIKKQDILQDSGNLKEMPYEVPAGYFSDFKEKIKAEIRFQEEKSMPQEIIKLSFWQKLSPYISLAAVFLMILAAGSFFLRFEDDTYDVSEEDYYMYISEHLPISYYEYIDNTDSSEEFIQEEDIIEYLIYTGVSIEKIELYK